MGTGACIVQVGAYTVLVIGVIGLLLRGVGVGRRAMALSLAAAGVIASGVAATRTFTVEGRHRSLRAVIDEIPQRGLREEGFASSSRCRSCHPAQYSTWHDSYHRTMTQVASPQAVVGDFDDVQLSSYGRSYQLERAGEEFWVTMPDPQWDEHLHRAGQDRRTAEPAPAMRKRVVMTTGSHHMQTYWVADDRDGKLYNMPFTWLNEDQRWVPREDVFLRPPSFPQMHSTWHNNCIECHSTAGEQMVDASAGTYRPEVAELGIACEACHGPAEAHIRANQDPRRRLGLRASGEPDPTIVNPARLDAVRSSHVCGQCHGVNVFKGAEADAGLRYRAGDDLTDTRMFLRMSNERMLDEERDDWPRLQRHVAGQPDTFLEERMWLDGMIRISGREHTAMIQSACFMGRELSCLSCHSMHESDPDDQLARPMMGDQACLQCHESYADDIEAHTHHPVGSTGSACYNCHMPHTTYGLMKGIRSHQIDSPTVASTLTTGRPNACNICHLDRTLQWSADHLREWYGQPEVTLTDDQKTVSSAVLHALTGDASQRALVAWHMGWEPARAASGRDWLVPYLSHLLADPYAAVRYIAERGLRTDPAFRDFDYDYIGPEDERSDARRRAVNQWMSGRGRTLDRKGTEILISRRGYLDVKTLTELSQRRDDRPIDLRE